MKISTTITEKKEVEFNIELPYFFKHDGTVYCVESEDSLVSACTTDYGYGNVHRNGVTNYITNKIAEGETITEEEFNQGVSEAMQFILNPVKEAV